MDLFSGVEFIHDGPVKVIKIDRTIAHPSFLVTPSNGPTLIAQKPSEQLVKFKQHLLINGGEFNGAAVQGSSGWAVTVKSYAASQAHVYCTVKDSPIMFINPEGVISFSYAPPINVYNAISGNHMLLVDGRIVAYDTGSINPRTAVGVSQDQRWVIIVLVDGNEADHTGATFLDLAHTLQDYGAFNGMSLDGGRDTTGAVLGKDGKTYILNVPSEGNIEGNEAEVANCLGITFSTPPLFEPVHVPEVHIKPDFTFGFKIDGVVRVVKFPVSAPAFNTQGMSWILPDWMTPTWSYTSRCVIKRIKVGIPQTVKCQVDTFLPMTERWQRYWWGLLKMEAVGLSDSILMSRWANLTKSDKFLTNFHGTEEGHDFIRNINTGSGLPAFETITIRRNIVKRIGHPFVSKGEEWQNVEALNADKMDPPDIAQINWRTSKHLVHAALTITPFDAADGKWVCNPFWHLQDPQGNYHDVTFPFISKGGIAAIRTSDLMPLDGKPVPSLYNY